MSPRKYTPGPRRRQATEATRSRIIEAAHALLADSQATSLSVDAIADRADVARMTVYYQFKSKAGLLEALFDDLAARANMQELRKAFQAPDPHSGVNTLIGVFCHFWQTQRAELRRLNALAVLDPEVGAALAERGSWRREALSKLIEPLKNVSKPGEVVDLLYVLTSFETYDALAAHNDASAIPKLLVRAAEALLQ